MTKPDDEELSAITSGKREFEVAIARIDDLHRRGDGLDRAERFGRRHFAGQIALHQEGEFRLNARMDIALLRERTAFLQPHGVGEAAPDHFIDADLNHFRARGQAHLHADELFAARKSALQRQRLDGVGLFDAERRAFGELRNGFRRARGLVDDLGEFG